jgi:capsular exopolysaccharide synthesis family protein
VAKTVLRTKTRNLIDPGSPFAESFRALRLALELRSDGKAGGRIILVTSAEPGEGKSTIAANYALASSLSGRRVLLLDADLKRPQVHEFLALPRAPGLVELLVSDDPSTNYARNVPGIGDLDVLTAGQPVARTGDVLASERMAKLLERAASAYDLVVVDSAPVLAAADVAGLCVHPGVNVVLVVNRTTKRRAVKNAVRELGLVDANILGMVVNREGRLPPYGYGYPG